MGQNEHFRDNLYTVNEKDERVMVRPKKQTGKFYNWRNAFAYIYLFVFFTLPFIKVNGNPLLLLNIPERKFIIFSVAFFPQDFFLFVLTMITFVVFIILFTAIFGRLFCGWACPQTIFMEMVFRKIEYWTEGDAQHQRNLDKMAWTAPEKLKKRGAKYLIYVVMSFIISNYFLMYIISFDNWRKLVTEPPSQHLLGLLIMLIFTGVFFAVFMYLREIVCTVICPYGRLQGVLLDKNSLVVAYDYVRGEPRGKLKKTVPNTVTMIDLPVIQQGDCIACNLCVQVCPTGIDIRNGTQLECINCTLCIDACDEIMTKVEKPIGLIRYASEQNIKDKEPFKVTRRILAYSAVLVALMSFLGFQLLTRTSLETVILRAPGQLFQEQAEGQISNLYTAKLFNKTHQPIYPVFRLKDKKMTIKAVGDKKWVVPKEGILEIEFFIVIPRSEVKERKTNLNIEIFDEQKKETIDVVETTFMGVPYK